MQIQKSSKNPIDEASHQLRHVWLRATQNRAGRWCLSLYVSLCFKITDFQEELQLKLFATSLKRNWVQRAAMGKWEERKKEEENHIDAQESQEQDRSGGLVGSSNNKS